MVSIQCTACPLGPGPQISHEFTGVEDDPHGGCLALGEAPGQQEVEERKPYCGRSGQLLRRGFAAVGLEPELIANMVLCRPPNNRTPHKSEVEACWNEHIRKLIEYRKPDLLLAIGTTASQWLTGEGVEKAHMQVLPCRWSGLPDVFVMRHPAGVLRNMPKLFPEFEADLVAWKNYCTPHLVQKPSLPFGYLVCDLETTGLNPDIDTIRGIALYGNTVNRYVAANELEANIWKEVFAGPTVWFNGAAFDMKFVPEQYQHLEVDDVLQMARILNRPVGSLAALSTLDLGVQHPTIQSLAIQHDCKVEDLSDSVLEEKALIDVEHTAKLFMLYSEELKRKGLWEIYQLEKAVSPIVRQIEKTGIPLDTVYLKTLNAELWKEFKEKEAEAKLLMPVQQVQLKTKVKEIPPKPTSRDQVVAVLLSEGVSFSKLTETGRYALDAEVLQGIDHPLAKAVLRMQQVKKQYDYTRAMKEEVRTDGRIAPHFNQLGTKSGRFSSSGEEDET